MSSFSISREGLIVQATRFPNIIPFKQRRQPMHGRISLSIPLSALLANSGSHKLALPIMQISALPLAINSSAIQGSVILPTVAIGIEVCFLISSASLA